MNPNDKRTLLDRRNLILRGSAISVGAMLSGCQKVRKSTLRAVDNQPDGYPTVEAVRHMGRQLEKESGGELSLKMFSGGQLGQEKDTLEIVIFGGLDLNRVNLAPLNSIAKETLVPALPFMFRSISHMRAAVDGAPGDQILEALEAHGLIGLCFYDSGARSFYTTSRSINSPTDLKGLKIRVQNSDLWVSMIEALGGDATPMAYGEVYQGLLQGVIDGAENNWPSYESTRHFEAAKFYSLTRHVMAPEVLVMSAKRWTKYSNAHQNLIRRAAKDSVSYMRKLWDDRVKRSQNLVLSAGVTVTEPDIQPFQDKVRPVWERYLTTPKLQNLADDIAAIGAI